MFIHIDGKPVDLSEYTYYGGMEDGLGREDLYRTPSREWVLHEWRVEVIANPTLRPIHESDAIRWLTEYRRSKKLMDKSTLGRRARESVPQFVVPHEEQTLCGQVIMGPWRELIIPEGSRTAAQIEERQTFFLEPEKVLECIMRPSAADIALTAGFRQERHDPLLARLQTQLEAKLVERPHIAVIQNRQDHGCDLVIDWPLRAKYGVQLKSNGDVEESEFARNTIQQIQDSRQHGLKKLFVILAADITGKSNLEKVRAIMSRISAQNDPYTVVIPPENAWNLLFPV